MAKIKITKKDILDNEVELPEGYEFKKVKTKGEKIKDLQDRIDVINQLIEPTDSELISYGRATEPYYETQREKEYLQNEINILNS